MPSGSYIVKTDSHMPPGSYFEKARFWMDLNTLWITLSLCIISSLTAPKIFQNKFHKPTHKYPTNFLTSKYIIPPFKLNKSKYGISSRGPTLRRSFLRALRKCKEVQPFLKVRPENLDVFWRDSMVECHFCFKFSGKQCKLSSKWASRFCSPPFFWRLLCFI